MRNFVLLLCSVLIVGASAVAQAAPGASPATADSQSQALPAPPPLHPMTVAQAREMLKLTHADELRRQIIDTMMKQLRQVFPPYMPEDVIDDLQTGMENADLDGPVIKVYQEHLSQKDAATIIAFYKTPAGQRLLTALPAISKESEEAGQRIGEQVARQVIASHKAEIIAAAKKYKAMHSLSSQP